jgi:hypothetical protein
MTRMDHPGAAVVPPVAGRAPRRRPAALGARRAGSAVRAYPVSGDTSVTSTARHEIGDFGVKELRC